MEEEITKRHVNYTCANTGESKPIWLTPRDAELLIKDIQLIFAVEFLPKEAPKAQKPSKVTTE